MTSVIHQPCDLGLLTSSKKEQRSYQFPRDPAHLNSKTNPDFKHKLNDCLRNYLPGSVPDAERTHALLTSAHNPEFLNAPLIPAHHEAPGPKEDVATFVALLRGCAKKKDLLIGNRLHDEILKKGLLEKCVDALVTMYAKCGALAKANELLDMYSSRDVITWTVMIAGYAQAGQGHNALKCFEHMQHSDVSPNAVTFSCVLKACGIIKAADVGKLIHDEISRQGLLSNNILLGNALVDMYCKCGALPKAHEVLDELPLRDVISWSTLIAGYAQHGQGELALKCFELMQGEGLSPNAVTFISILKACGSIGAGDKGKQIHKEIARQGLLANNIALGTALVDMHAKCGALEKAQEVLEELPYRDVISWNALIAGYVQNGLGRQALDCFQRMQGEGLSPNTATFACTLKACGSMGAADRGAQIHDEIARRGLLNNNVVLGTAVVDMYAKSGAFAKAKQVLEELPFRDVSSWNALISGYAQHCRAVQALNCFECMQCEGVSPNEVTFTCMLKVCGYIGALSKGKQIHDEIAKQGLLEGSSVLGTALVDMYAKCGALAKALEVFGTLPSWDVITWSTLIAGYAQHGHSEHALNCFEQMQREGVSPNAVTFISALKACGNIGAADKGKELHNEIARQRFLGNDNVLGTALVDMYAKCGALDKAQQLLEELPSRNVVNWSALMAGYSKEGRADQVLICFERMKHEGIVPNAVTFSCVLNACSDVGLVDEGHAYFRDMTTEYCVKPDLEHYACMVDLFGRAGQLDKAVRVIQEMPSWEDSIVWASLLGACQKWGDVDVGRWAFEHAVLADKCNVASYVLMANIYAAAGMQEDAGVIEALRLKNKAWVIGVS